MAIEFGAGNLLLAQVDALVNTVNTVGAAGKGIALQFRQAFPENFRLYERAAKNGEIEPGRMFVTSTGLMQAPHYIVNFPTKRHWRGNSTLSESSTSTTFPPSQCLRWDVATAAWIGTKFGRSCCDIWNHSPQ
jgi:O-acetyl-ADP-ribose deacetylase (regulator of RNase III)